MKKIITLGVMLAAAFSLTNCTEELQTAPEVEKTPYTIYANAVETKTVNNGFSTKWYAGSEDVEPDALNVFHTEAGTYWYSDNSKFVLVDAEKGQFETELLQGGLYPKNDWCVLYPYNQYVRTPLSDGSGDLVVGAPAGVLQVQKGYDSMKHIAGPNYPMWGIAEGVDSQELPYIRMTHLTSLVEVEVTNATEESVYVGGVSVKAAEDIIGNYYIDFSSKTPGFTKAEAVSDVAKLNVTDRELIEAGKSAKFYVAVKPFTATAGSVLALSVNGNEKVLEMTNDVVFAPGKVKTLKYKYDVALPEVGPYTSNMLWTLGERAYNQTAETINEVSKVPVLKLGSGSGYGSAKITVTAGTTKIGFYAVAWNSEDTNLALKLGDEVVAESYLYRNEGFAGQNDYIINEEGNLCYHEFEINAIEDAEYTLTTTDDYRALIWGLNYYTADGIGEMQTPAIPEYTIAEVLGLEEKEEVVVNGLAIASYTGAFLVQDETGTILVYGADATAGDMVKVSGLTGAYGGMPQITGPTVTVVSSGNAVTHPDPTELDGAGLDAMLKEKTIQYIKYTGQLSVSGKYYNVNVDGTSTAIGSIQYPLESLGLAELNGKFITVEGYFIGVSSGKFVNTMVVKVTEEETPTVEMPATEGNGTLESPYTVADALKIIESGAYFNLEGNVHVAGIVSTVPSVSADYGNANYNISDDGSPTNQLNIYRGDYINAEPFPVDHGIKIGDKVIILGKLTKYSGTPQIAEDNYIVSHEPGENSGEDQPAEVYTLVTDASTLAVGNKVIIVAAAADFALSTNQKTNNRDQAAITKTENTISVTSTSGVQVITLEKGLTDGTWAFNVGNGYLYAASSSSNHLKTSSSLTGNGSWAVEISADGVATVKAQGDATRNWMRYNSSSSLFACYASGQADISIYKLTE